MVLSGRRRSHPAQYFRLLGAVECIGLFTNLVITIEKLHTDPMGGRKRWHALKQGDELTKHELRCIPRIRHGKLLLVGDVDRLLVRGWAK